MPRKKQKIRLIPAAPADAVPVGVPMVSGREDPPDLEAVMRMLAGTVMLLGGKVELTEIELARLGDAHALGILFTHNNHRVTLTLHRTADLTPEQQAIVERDRKLAEQDDEP